MSFLTYAKNLLAIPTNALNRAWRKTLHCQTWTSTPPPQKTFSRIRPPLPPPPDTHHTPPPPFSSLRHTAPPDRPYYHVLCISTSKLVLSMPVKIICFWKQVFSSFSVTNGKNKEKIKESAKITQKTCIKGGLQVFKCIFPRSWPAFGCQPAFKS